jgi:stage II sporulation protein GA (sporulation sigma-E factor processing peptidase)
MIYLDLVFLLNFLVDFLLLLGTNRLAGFPTGWGRASLAALLGGVYAAGCLLPGFRFLGSTFWRMVMLSVLSLIAFGMNRSAFHRGAVFVLLSMALGGIASGTDSRNFSAVICCGAVLWVLCRIGFRGQVGSREYVPVQLRLGEKSITRIALRDTGNTLKDPLTGEQVLVAGEDAAAELLGLSAHQLRHPIETLAMGEITGLRLIPYHSVGNPAGMLLAFRFHGARIGEKEADPLVAFAPERIGGGDVYQMLTGGVI